MPGYDKSLIIEFLTGNADHIITKGSTDLQKKVGGNIVTVQGVRPEPLGLPRPLLRLLAQELGGLTKTSRLYLRGHGDWKHQAIGGWSAKNVAALLKKCGMPACFVSVTGCNAARFDDYSPYESASGLDPPSFGQMKTVYNNLLECSTHSFGGLLHSYLGKSCGLEIELVARTYYVAVKGDGSKVVSPGGHQADWHKKRYTKIRFTWENGTQRRDWVTYD